MRKAEEIKLARWQVPFDQSEWLSAPERAQAEIIGRGAGVLQESPQAKLISPIGSREKLWTQQISCSHKWTAEKQQGVVGPDGALLRRTVQRN